ncbi:unnamed protein product [Allacma fusca]|uniref:peptidylprolyl isomerase n=1 Tax=Allacma fusca TaxID=39272 RepID=A0A8J2NZI9_9HEXA|nr:unnamed protein product [Allacma fusca]
MPAEEVPSEEEIQKPQTVKAENKNRINSADIPRRRCCTYPDATTTSDGNTGYAYNKRNCKSACLTENMMKEIRKKADVRASRTNDPTHRDRVTQFKEHRYRVKTARAQVDSSTPSVPKNLYRNASYNRRVANFARIERENTIMLRHLAEIIHGKGMVDNRLNRGTCINNRGQARQMRLLRITFDNLSLLKRIQSQKPFYSRKTQLDEYHKMEQTMRHLSYYPLYWHLSKEGRWGPYEAKAKANAMYRPRPRVFMALGNSTEFYGKILIELFATECPMTAENFRGLCTGEYGISYKCSTIHKVIQDILWQGGDLSSPGVSGSKSIYGDTFPDENFKIKHDKCGIVTMANWGPNTNGSQFIITAKKMSILDGCNVAFGQVIAGFHVLSQLCSKLTPSGKPKKKFYIIDCGELDPGETEFDEYQDACNLSEPDQEQETTLSEPATYITDEEDPYADNLATGSIR